MRRSQSIWSKHDSGYTPLAVRFCSTADLMLRTRPAMLCNAESSGFRFQGLLPACHADAHAPGKDLSLLAPCSRYPQNGVVDGNIIAPAGKATCVACIEWSGQGRGDYPLPGWPARRSGQILEQIAFATQDTTGPTYLLVQ